MCTDRFKTYILKIRKELIKIHKNNKKYHPHPQDIVEYNNSQHYGRPDFIKLDRRMVNYYVERNGKVRK